MRLRGVDVGYDLGMHRYRCVWSTCDVCGEPAAYVQVFWIPPYGRDTSEIMQLWFCTEHGGMFREAMRRER